LAIAGCGLTVAAVVVAANLGTNWFVPAFALVIVILLPSTFGASVRGD
jgi:hypothetical protein